MEWGLGRWLKKVKCLPCQPDDLNSIPQTQDKRRERTQSYMFSSGLAVHAVVCMQVPSEYDLREGCSLPWSLLNPEGDKPSSTVRKAELQQALSLRGWVLFRHSDILSAVLSTAKQAYKQTTYPISETSTQFGTFEVILLALAHFKYVYLLNLEKNENSKLV